jgi:hypothetical protein
MMGRIHYEMPFESVEKGKLGIGGFDIQIYDPVAHTLSRYFAKADHSLPSEPTAEVRDLKLMSEWVMLVPPARPKDKGAESGAASSATQDSNTTNNAAASEPSVVFIPTKEGAPPHCNWRR